MLTGVAALIAASDGATAADGVVEISQSRATAGSISPGDAPGFPITLSQPGNYVLTSDLDVRGLPGGADLVAVDITADDVRIDLNGFRIVGPTVCSGVPGGITCTPGLGVGVRSTGRGSRILDGSVSGFALGGAVLGPEARIADLRAAYNGTVGMSASDLSVVQNAVAIGNGGSGITLGASGVVSGCNASQNDDYGLALGTGSGFSGCVVNGNGTGAVNGGMPLGSNLCSGSSVCGSGCIDLDSDGFAANCNPLDCEDSSPAINPGAPEICDGSDNDCDTEVDEGGACAGSCNPFDPAPVCGLGVHCNPGTVPYTGICSGPAGTGTQGAPCTGEANCAPGFGCVNAGSFQCLALCDPAAPACPGGTQCFEQTWYGFCL
jgi:hypothetical protein